MVASAGRRVVVVAACLSLCLSLVVDRPTTATIGVQIDIKSEGFDTCEKVDSSDLTDWWTNTPWYGLGTYLGGSNGIAVGCAPLSKTTITAAATQGWSLVPFWYGLQEPSSCITSSFP